MTRLDNWSPNVTCPFVDHCPPDDGKNIAFNSFIGDIKLREPIQIYQYISPGQKCISTYRDRAQIGPGGANHSIALHSLCIV